MEPGLSLQIVWSDQNALEVAVRAWNGSFGGHADVYCGLQALGSIADAIRGFPRGTGDMREVTLGSLERKYAGGGVKLRFHCVDSPGHAFVEVMIDSNHPLGGTVQTALVSLPVEATAVDSFVEALVRMGTTHEGSARLRTPPLR